MHVITLKKHTKYVSVSQGDIHKKIHLAKIQQEHIGD